MPVFLSSQFASTISISDLSSSLFKALIPSILVTSYCFGNLQTSVAVTAAPVKPKGGDLTKMGRQKWTDDQFGKRIKGLRERRRLSQTQMAAMLTRRKTPMHATTLAKIEAGTRSVRINEAVALAELFDVTVDALLGRTGPDQSTV